MGKIESRHSLREITSYAMFKLVLTLLRNKNDPEGFPGHFVTLAVKELIEDLHLDMQRAK